MTQNPNWPKIEEAVGFLTTPSTQAVSYVTQAGSTYLTFPAEAGIWCDLTKRTQGTWASNRGRQYELDQVQTGTVQTALDNRDGALDPHNTSSPFYPAVKLYRGYRRRAQYPITANLLYADTAAGVAFVNGSPSAPRWTTVNPTYPVRFGNGVIPTTIPAGTAVWTVGGFAIIPGLPYSGQGTCFMAVGSTLTVAAQFNWYHPDGTVTTTTGTPTSCTSSGTRVTVSGSAPTSAIGATLSFVVTPPASSQTIQNFASMQVEQASAPTGPVSSNWYDLFTGFVERWPQAWSDSGMYGTTDVQAVDAFGYLSQRQILSPGYMEILSAGASWLWPMDEPSGSTGWNDLTGNSLPAQVVLPNVGSTTQCAAGAQLPASTTVGVSVSGPPPIAYLGNGFNPAGVSGPCTQFANRGTGGAALLDIGTAKGTVGPSPATGWTMIFLVNTPASTSNLADQTVWAAYDGSGGSNQLLQLRATAQNFYEFDVSPASGVTTTISLATNTVYANPPAASANDGCWHLLIVQMSADGKTLTGWLDNFASPVTATSATDMRPTFPAGSRETFGGIIGGSGGVVNGWSGYLSTVGYIPAVLPATAGLGLSGAVGSADTSSDPPSIAALRYTLLLNGNPNPLYANSPVVAPFAETSGVRYRDIIRWAGWQGLRAVDCYTSGQTTAYGPPTDLLASVDSGGTDAVTAGQTVVDTENGEQFIDRSGVWTFHRRGYRYNTTPQVIFGENTGAGEIPYLQAAFDYDPTRVADDIQLTQTQSGITYRQINPTAIANYGDIALQRTVNTVNILEIKDALSWLLLTNANPSLRVSGITVDVGAYPAAWPALLSLELATPVRVMRRPPLGAAAIQVDGFVEQINWTIDDQGHATVDLQISPTVSQQFWQLDSATYSVLGSTTIAGY